MAEEIVIDSPAVTTSASSITRIDMDKDGVKLRAGSFISIGGRPYQEDRVVIIDDLNAFCEPCDAVAMSAMRRSFYAIFDGHGGSKCSEYMSKNFHLLLATHPKLRFSPMVALQEAWMKAEESLLSTFQWKANQEKNAHFPHDGSTATVCLIVGEECFITNCGDSAACMQYQDGSVRKVTEDHGTLNDDELKRVEAAGGYFKIQTVPSRCGCLPFCAKDVEVGKPRLYPGGLLVTRAFGDFFAKIPIYGGIEGALIPDHGEIEYTQLNAPKAEGIKANTGSLNSKKVSPVGAGTKSTTNFVKRIILASDGVWDSRSHVEVCGHINDVLAAAQVTQLPELPPVDDATGFPMYTTLGTTNDENSVQKYMAASVCRFALTGKHWQRERCSPDNTSCIVIDVFQHGVNENGTAFTMFSVNLATANNESV